MALNILNHSETYEWSGVFWFPENESEDFSGKVIYTPDKGIVLELLAPVSPPGEPREFLTRKRLFGIVNTKDPTPITLVNVAVNRSLVIKWGKSTSINSSTLSGGAVMMVLGEFLESSEIERLEVKYEERLENIFLWFKETDAIQFKNASLKIGSDSSISFNARSSLAEIRSEQDIDAAFSHNNEEKFLPIKAAIKAELEDKSFYLLKRYDVFSTFLFTRETSRVRDFLDLERNWRFFWELILDHRVNVENAWVHLKVRDTDRYMDRPVLVSHFRPEASYAVPKVMPMLPISLSSFGGDNRYELSHIQEPINKWLEINNDSQWQPVLEGLRRVLMSGQDIVDTTKYVALLSEIETFLDLTGAGSTFTDKLIELYASDSWKQEVLTLTEGLDQEETLGKWMKQIRNAIAHPVSMSKDPKTKKYVDIAADEIKVHKVYAYLGGLFLKGLFSHIGGIDTVHIDKYVDAFIKNRVGVGTIEYQ